MAAATLVALGACAHGHKHEVGDEYVKAIKLEGNQKLKSKTLVAGLALERSRKGDRPPDPYLVQVDADRIRGQYLRKGFLAVDVRSRVERAGDATTVIYTVEEGERAKTKVVVNGVGDDPELTIDKIRSKLPLKDGAPFDYATYELAKEPLLAIAKDAGYARAKLDTTVYADRANHEATITLDYKLGPKCKFGPVELSGVDGDLADAVRARVAFKAGDPYSTKAIIATQRALYGLQRFSLVQVQPDDSETSPIVRVTVAVHESARRELKLGAGFGIDPTAYEVRGLTGYTITGWPFAMDTVTLNLRPAYAMLRDRSGYEPRVRALARFERQDLLWTYSKGEVEAGYNYLSIEAYTQYGPRGRLGFSTPVFSKRLQLRVGWDIQRVDFRNISPLLGPTLEEALGLDRTEQIATYNETFVIDLRDHPIEPRLGFYAELHLAEGTRYAGSQYQYLQAVPELRGFVPIGRVVLASRVRAGTIYGDVPPTERFFGGGASSHRGFGERKLSPYVEGDVMGTDRIVPYGGSTLLETGLEARIPITTWRKMPIGGVTFLDGGDVTESYKDLDPGNLHWAAGVGLRVHTIVGPVRADLGYRLNRTGPMEPAPGSHYAFHLSLGEAF